MSLPPVTDLFSRHRAKESGVWRLGADPHRMVYLDHGDIVFAQSTHPQDRLTHLLVERGLLTQAQLDYALANLKPGISVGKNLIDMGFITQRVLLDVARLQVERVVWGAMAAPEETPSFEAKELESNVVKLSFETPLLLLNGLLGLQDREQVLELLGPLNQVVVLEGRRITELSLPADLAKLPPLLDGTRTLLELARESGVEPLRLGAFALFLREMGWARLHELPPLDRAAVDLAISPDPEPPSPVLPEAPSEEPAPSLFASIEAAAKPTTNLEHLSEALDTLPDLPPPVTLPEDEESEPPLPVTPQEAPVEAEEGHAELPTPRMELPAFEPESEEGLEPAPAEPEPRIHLPLVDEPAPEAQLPPPPEGLDKPPASSHNLLKIAGVITATMALVGLGIWWRRSHAPKPGTEVVQTPAPKPPEPKPEPEPKTEPKPEPKREPEPKAEPKPEAPPPPVDSKAGRLLALRKGDLAEAQALSRALVAKEPKAWTLRLLIACQADTVQNIPGLFPVQGPDLFILPIAMRDGRTCTQVFYGTYASAKAAEAAMDSLPTAFQAKGSRPKVFAIAEIPAQQ